MDVVSTHIYGVYKYIIAFPTRQSRRSSHAGRIERERPFVLFIASFRGLGNRSPATPAPPLGPCRCHSPHPARGPDKQANTTKKWKPERNVGFFRQLSAGSRNTHSWAMRGKTVDICAMEIGVGTETVIERTHLVHLRYVVLLIS